MWLTRQERVAVAILGGLAVAGLGFLAWQRRARPLLIEQHPEPVEAAQWDAALDRSRQVDLNRADVAELERLPQVGPALAQQIVAYRAAHGPFVRTDELIRVKGIGPKTYEAIRDSLTVE